MSGMASSISLGRFRVIIGLKNCGIQRRLLDLAKRVSDDDSKHLLKERTHEHFCWRQNPGR